MKEILFCALLLMPLTIRVQEPSSKSSPRQERGVPFPDGRSEKEILANVAAAVQQGHLDEFMGDRLAMRAGELHARRILGVVSLTDRPDFYVVELVDHDNASVADIAIAKGGAILQARLTHGQERHSVDLASAQVEAGRFTDAPARTARYVHLYGMAELGSPLFTPLAEVETTKGRIYVNSRHEGFAEEGSAIEKEARDPRDDHPIPAGTAKLRLLKPKIGG